MGLHVSVVHHFLGIVVLLLGDIGVVEYLIQLQQLYDAQESSIELQGQAWVAWLFEIALQLVYEMQQCGSFSLLGEQRGTCLALKV